MIARRIRRDTLIDWLPVVALPPVMIADAALSHHHVSVVGVASAFVACLPLVWRRRLGFWQLIVPVVAGIVLVLALLTPGNSVAAIPMVALFECARRGSRRRTLAMSLTVPVCVVVSIIPSGTGTQSFVDVAVQNIALCLLAIAAGEITRTRDEAATERVQVEISGERLRIAREVHDALAHSLVAINVQTGVAAHLLDRDPDHVRGALEEIRRASGDALTDLRAMLGLLRDPVTGASLAPAARLDDLEELATGLRAAGVQVALDVQPLDAIPAVVHAAGYRIVQEALTNVLRHARAGHADVQVRRTADEVWIEVADDGTAASTATDGAGQGLRGMRERANALGGRVECGPDAAGGWRVRASLPLPGRAPV